MNERSGSAAKDKLNAGIKKINTKENRAVVAAGAKTLWSKFYDFAKKQDDKIYILGLGIMAVWDTLRLYVWTFDVAQIHKTLNTLKIVYYGVFAYICHLNMNDDPRIEKWMGFIKQKRGKFMFNVFIAMLIWPMDPPTICIDGSPCISGANGWLGYMGSMCLFGISLIHLYAYCKDGEINFDQNDTEPMMDEEHEHNPNFAD